MARLVRDDNGWKMKRKRQRGAAQALQQQEDILFQILTRVCVKSLTRFKLACKSWMALISHPFFINSQHLHRSNSDPHEIITMKVAGNSVAVLMDGKGRRKSWFPLFCSKFDRNLKFRHDPTIVHCDGLFLIGRTAQRLTVCNPATRELVALPRTRYVHDVSRSGVGIGLDRSTNKYKVVRIYARRQNYKRIVCGIDVITLGAPGNSWRQKACDLNCDITWDCTVVIVQGAAYCKIFRMRRENKYNEFDNLAILRFDLSNEKFISIAPPDPNNCVFLVELQRHLYCYTHDRACEEDPAIRFWLLNDNLDGWTLRYTIHLSDPTLPQTVWFSFTPIAIDQEGCLLFKSLQHMHCYNPRTNQFYMMGRDAYAPNKFKDSSSRYCHITSYVETIMPISSDRR